jgi:hypothetical protein
MIVYPISLSGKTTSILKITVTRFMYLIPHFRAPLKQAKNDVFLSRSESQWWIDWSVQAVTEIQIEIVIEIEQKRL